MDDDSQSTTYSSVQYYPWVFRGKPAMQSALRKK